MLHTPVADVVCAELPCCSTSTPPRWRCPGLRCNYQTSHWHPTPLSHVPPRPALRDTQCKHRCAVCASPPAVQPRDGVRSNRCLRRAGPGARLRAPAALREPQHGRHPQGAPPHGRQRRASRARARAAGAADLGPAQRALVHAAGAAPVARTLRGRPRPTCSSSAARFLQARCVLPRGRAEQGVYLMAGAARELFWHRVSCGPLLVLGAPLAAECAALPGRQHSLVAKQQCHLRTIYLHGH